MPSVQASSNNQTEQLQSTSKDSKTASNNQLNANTGGNKTPSEQPEYIKQVQIMIEKKVRNLDKRRQKLEEYQAQQRKGEKLNDDQLAAVNKYGEVQSSLELVKDLDKQLITLANDTMKQLKKQAKKEQIEREETLREKLREVERIKSLLNTFTLENIRNDFLDGRNGAVQLTRDELSLFDEFNKLVSTSSRVFKPVENELNEAVDHLFNLIDNKNKTVLTTTYNELRKLFEKVMTSSYWTQEPEKPAPQPVSQPQQQQQQQVEPEQSQPLQSETSDNEQKQTVYQHNTSTEDYVIVTSQEVENTQQQVQQQQQQQQQEQGTFFTTLNNENLKFDSNNEEINFLQDSEIPQQYEEQHHEQQVQEHHQQQFSQQQSHGNNNYGFGKPRYNNDGNYQPRNNGNGNRRPYTSDNNDRRGVSRGGYRGGPQGGRGGYQSGANRGNYRGVKPRNGPPSGNNFRNNNQPETRVENH